MLEIISKFTIGFVTHLVDCYVYTKVEKEAKFEWNGRLIMAIIIFSFIDCFVDKYYGIGMRFLIVNINMIVLLKIMYNKSSVGIIIFSLFAALFYAVGELGVSILLVGIIKIKAESLTQIPMNYITNIMIIGIYYYLYGRKIVKETIEKMMNWYKENEIVNLILISISVMILVGCLLYPLSFSNMEERELLGFSLFIISSVIFVSGFFKQKSDNNELQTKYEIMNEYSRTYEKLLAKKSREEHEHKNQLIIIREKSHKNNKEIRKYIDEILEKKEEADEYDYIKKLRNIPEGGLKGLLYYKIEKMLEEKIETYVNVTNKLSKKKIWKEVDKDIRDISLSLGVYIDNAIEAAKEAKKKYIVIEVNYEEEEICFEISNTYGEKVGEEGKSSKGIGRGQGLILVRNIIEKNPKLREEKELSGSYYVQKLYYSIK